MEEDCQALVRGCHRCKIFDGVVVKVKEKVLCIGWMRWQHDVRQTLRGTNSHSHKLTKSFGVKRCYATIQEK